jgi:hypothetical protein
MLPVAQRLNAYIVHNELSGAPFEERRQRPSTMPPTVRPSRPGKSFAGEVGVWVSASSPVRTFASVAGV